MPCVKIKSGPRSLDGHGAPVNFTSVRQQDIPFLKKSNYVILHTVANNCQSMQSWVLEVSAPAPKFGYTRPGGCSRNVFDLQGRLSRCVDGQTATHKACSVCVSYCRRKFRSQTSDNMDRWKRRGGKSQRREEQKREYQSEKRKSEKKEDAGARKGSKVAKHCVFPMICGSGGSKSRLAKAAGAEPCGQMRDEHLHAVVARSTFPSQNAQSTPFSDHFWKLRCRKSARRGGAKHMSK